MALQNCYLDRCADARGFAILLVCCVRRRARMNRPSTSLTLWRLWSAVAKQSFHSRAKVAKTALRTATGGGRGDDGRQSWAVFFFFVALVGAAASAVCIPQAWYQ